MRHQRHLLTAVLITGLAVMSAQAKVPPEKAAELGDSLTPVGAVMQGNQEGTIPKWDPWPRHGDMSGAILTCENFPDTICPLLKEEPRFTITADNYKQYADKLAAGYERLFKLYPETYHMNVYPTHRNVGYPDFIYKWTRKNATSAYLDGCNDCLREAEMGFPFPIPQSGTQVIWNHRVRWRGEAVRRQNDQAIIQQDGSVQITQLVEEVKFPYTLTDQDERIRVNDKDDIIIYYQSETLSPPRTAGQFLLAWEHVGYRSAWLYSPALRRVRRAPNVAYDNPYEGTDGMQFYDQVDMYNGALDRYNYKLLGKKEMIIPYNNYAINNPSLTYAGDILKKHHLNQDLMRYELHRVWVVEATLQPDTSHQFWRRTFYVDEDGWNIVNVDCYGNRKKLWRFQEAANIWLPNGMFAGGSPEVIYDLQSGTWFVTALTNEGEPNNFAIMWTDRHFSPRALRRRATR